MAKHLLENRNALHPCGAALFIRDGRSIHLLRESPCFSATTIESNNVQTLVPEGKDKTIGWYLPELEVTGLQKLASNSILAPGEYRHDQNTVLNAINRLASDQHLKIEWQQQRFVRYAELE